MTKSKHCEAKKLSDRHSAVQGDTAPVPLFNIRAPDSSKADVSPLLKPSSPSEEFLQFDKVSPRSDEALEIHTERLENKVIPADRNDQSLKITFDASTGMIHIPKQLFPTNIFGRWVSPEIIQPRLLLMADFAEKASVSLNRGEYTEGLRRLYLLTNLLMNNILSRQLPNGVTDTLDRLFYSLESCKQLVYSGIRNGNITEIIEQHQIIDFLVKMRTVLNAFAAPEEWRERMIEEWGGTETSTQ